MHTRQSPVVWGLSALVIIALSGCNNGTASIGESSLSNAESMHGPTRVQTVQPEVTALRRTTTQPVTVHAFHEADINAKVSGYVTELNVDIGDHLQQGDVLAVLAVPEMVKDIEEKQALIKRLLAEEKQAAANRTLAAANVKAAEASLAQSRSEIQKSDADLKAEQAEFRRIEELVSRRSVEARMEDEARQRLESAQAAGSAAKAAVTSAQANVGVAQAKLEAAHAEIERASADTAIVNKQLEKLRTLMNYASLVAPFSGVVMARNVDLGDLVSNAQASNGHRTALFTLGQVDHVRVRASIPEDDAPWTTVGDSVTVHLSALRGRTYSGTVSRITKSLDTSTRTMLAEIDLENPEEHLLPGMYGEASFVLDERADALVLPASAVRFDAVGNAYVYTVDSDGVVQIVEITTGVDDGHRIEIVSGLTQDAQVIDGMLDRLTEGQVVQVEQ